MCSWFSSFSICAALIGNIPVVSFSQSEEVALRYQALFEYDLVEVEATAVRDFQPGSQGGQIAIKKLLRIVNGLPANIWRRDRS